MIFHKPHHILILDILDNCWDDVRLKNLIIHATQKHLHLSSVIFNDVFLNNYHEILTLSKILYKPWKNHL